MLGKEVDLSDKIVLITGASDGIGKETALALAKKKVKMIIMPCRKSEKASKAHELICENYPSPEKSNIVLDEIDLADLHSIKAFVDRFLERNIKIDILINNAGLILSEKKLTKDGFEMQFGTNYLGHFLLTDLLLSNNAFKSEHAKVINLSSHAMLFGHIDFDDVNFEHRSYSSWKAYTQSKLANVIYANYLNRTYPNITASSVHPGMVRTTFAKNSGMFYILDVIFYPVFYLLSKSPADGAKTTIYVASHDGLEGGKYWANNKPYTLFSNKDANDAQLQEKLVDFSRDLVSKHL